MLAFLDESGDVNPPHRSAHFLAIGIIMTEEHTARAVELHVKRLKRSRKKPISELKAWSATPSQRKKLLTAIADEDIAIVAVILDKTGVIRTRGQLEENHRKVVSLAVLNCIKLFPQLDLIVDKRYTNKALRDRLDQSILSELAGSSYERINIKHGESQKELSLQAADYVAWAVRQKYESDERGYYDLIRHKIVCEVVTEAK